MQGRKPTPTNVIPLTGAREPRPAPEVLAKRFCPRGVSKAERREWTRVATILAAPELDRLKPQYVDTILEYCRTSLRLRSFREFFLKNDMSSGDLAAIEGDEGNTVDRVTGEPGLDAEIYVVHGRNGTQLKAHPYVAQANETWRQWRSLMMELGLSPASERNLAPGQGDLFGDPAERYFAGASR